MKHPSVFLCLTLILCAAPDRAAGQYHQKTSSGVKQMNNSYVSNTPAAKTGNTRSPGRLNVVIISQDAIDMAAKARARIESSTMALRDPDFWTRVENHTNGTFTETKQDATTEHDDDLVIQKTKSKNGTLLFTRKISLDPMGRPTEVMIYDGRGNFRYRGELVYDQYGRLTDEIIYDTSGTPLRRTWRKFDAEGQPLPLEKVDFVDNLPPDFQLVVSEPDAALQKRLNEIEAEARQEARRLGLLDRLTGRGEASNSSRQPGPEEASRQDGAVDGESSEGPKWRLFRRRD